jgi:hypothetical protein
MKDKREVMLVFKGKDINLVMDAVELEAEMEKENKYEFGREFTKLDKKIKEVMRIE